MNSVQQQRKVLMRKASKKRHRGSLRFGKRQLKRMLVDRPAMSSLVEPDDAIWQTCIRMFAGTTISRPVFWKSEEDQDDLPGYYRGGHRFDPSNGICYVQVRSMDGCGNELDAEVMWSVPFYEFYNIANHAGFHKIGKRAFSGELSKREYIELYTRLEYKALAKLVSFYRDVWLPEVKRKCYRSNETKWLRGFKSSYEDWISQYTKADYYPFDVFGRHFEEVIVPDLKLRNITVKND